ncbi:hypothetical protein IWW38_003805 [Coemansia aciculifera]|uniref:Uncharacterized protein n=1 Tax=Coemansia aciculifera TaxID=417176 RepID=A0ACC1M0E9_9FUNG|nr:hypothetical protein IWW38_003805 [Coemansia aciculifera]
MGGQTRPKKCVFCSGKLERIVYKDDAFMVFHDRKPDAEVHLLVIPRTHYGTINDMTPSELPMLTQMHELGQRLLDEMGYTGDMARFGFHRPPFNSIHHLHLHCLGLPFKSGRASFPFSESNRLVFMPVARLIDSLSKSNQAIS